MASNRLFPFKPIVYDIIVNQLSADKARAWPNASLVDDLGASSGDLAEIIEKIEKKFSIKISTEEIDGLITIENVWSLINSKIKWLA